MTFDELLRIEIRERVMKSLYEQHASVGTEKVDRLVDMYMATVAQQLVATVMED